MSDFDNPDFAGPFNCDSEYLKGIRDYRITIENDTHGGYQDTFSPTTDWSQGGPIIEREDISILRCFGCWRAEKENYDHDTEWVGQGPTPLIAAMRCYVVSKLGETVEVPEELCK